MKREARIFFTALMFYTRFPVPKSTGFSSDNLNRATKYFPLIGIIIGGIGAAVFFVCNTFLSVNISVMASMSLMILSTGAFHEDALADFCDGFGGGYNYEQTLKIMKDSFIGTYGTVGLIMLLLSKFVLLTEIDAKTIPLILVAAHAMSRLNPVLLIYTSSYVRNESESKSKPVGEKHKSIDLLLALCFGLAPALFFFPLHVLLITMVAFAGVFVYFRYYVHKKIGGYTGDVLGALQQISEIAFYIAFFLAKPVYAFIIT